MAGGHDHDGGVGAGALLQRGETLELRAALARERMIFEHVYDAVFVYSPRLDADGRLVDLVYADLNAAAERQVGAPRGEVIGRSMWEVFPRHCERGFFAQYRRVFETGEPLEQEFEITVEPYAGWYQHQVLRAPGGGIVIIQRKITDHKQIQREREELQEQLRHAQKMESLGRLAGGIAHDFNNLLTPILAYTNMALAKLDDGAPLYEELQEIRHAADHASALIRQILTFSRKQTSQVLPLSLNDVVDGFARMLRRIVGDDVELDFELEPELANVVADPAQIEQVLANLVVNARDAITGEGRIVVRTRNAELREPDPEVRAFAIPPGRYVLLEISDTGAGMAPEVLSRVFEPFFTTKGQVKGTGLGLSIVYGVVAQHGGYIRCESEPGRGATFRLFFPRTDEAALTGDDDAVAADAPAPACSDGTILLVEDDEAVRKLTRHILVEQGYKVLEADHGVSALRVAEEHPGPIDLLLTDVVMPKMDGRQLHERLSARRPGLRVLYMSGFADVEISHGRFIAKPFAASALLQIVREALAERAG